MKNIKQLLLTVGVSLVTVLVTLHFGKDFIKEFSPQANNEKTELAQPVKFTNYVTNTASAGKLTNFTRAASMATPGVVHVKTVTVRNTPSNYQQHPLEQLFGYRWGTPQQAQPRRASGSGVIISSDGFIVTNNHVIKEADEIEVSLNNNKTYTAELIGSDPNTDLALLKIDAQDLSYIPFGNSDSIQVGSWVLAVGNPFNLASTVTAGIVSAKGRNINILEGNAAIESFIQTDAAVNPGNSGGALVDISGNLIGINTAIASPTGSYSGYAFAVPSNLAGKVVQDLMQYGLVQRGFLGVSIRNVDQKLANELELDIPAGVYVQEVIDGSAAREAGIEKGDVITRINKVPIGSASKLQEIVAQYRPGDKLSVTYLRKGNEYDETVVLKNKNQGTELLSKEEVSTLEVLGVEFEELTHSELKSLGLEHGIRVAKIKEGKIKRYTDMREGFIISSIDKQPVESKEDVINLMSNKKGGVMIEGKYEDYPGSYYYAFGM